jgi:hypothetical protein
VLLYLFIYLFIDSLLGIIRGVNNVDDSNYVLGEKDAIWMLKLVLPYLNECLSKLKALFSGDPGTTMKVIFLYIFSTLHTLLVSLTDSNAVGILGQSFTTS